MLFAVLLFLSPISIFGNFEISQTASSVTVAAAETSSGRNVTVSGNSAKSVPSDEAALPSTPEAKPANTTEILVAGAPSPAGAFPAIQPVKAEQAASYNESRKKKIWYGLVVTGHSGAMLDAWSTRRALSRNYGTEGDPLMRPFAHSSALYFVTQVSPTVLDIVGGRAISSSHPWVRRLWWIPQTAGAAFSFGAGAHNVSLVP